jgi:hypothetical protein
MVPTGLLAAAMAGAVSLMPAAAGLVPAAAGFAHDGSHEEPIEGLRRGSL